MNIRKTAYYGAHRLIGSSLGQVYEAYRRDDSTRVPLDTAERSLIKLLNHCEQNVPYYSNVIATLGGDYQHDPESYLRCFPILTKDLIRENFKSLISKDLSNRQWIFNTSGGSTGEPIKLIQDRAYTDRQMAVQMLSFDWAGRAFGEPAVRVWGSERDVLQGSAGLKMKMLNYLTNDQYLNAFRMTPVNMRAFITELNTRRPQLIIAYAQAIYELAKFAEREAISIVPQVAVLTSAGTLYGFMREKIETVFQCKVYDRYGSREVGDIACECSTHAGLHVFPWTNYVEVVDDAGQRVPNGVEGHILVTSLTNFAMPLIRYAIGDRGVLCASECACGRRGQLLQKVLGRSVDAFRAADGTLVDGEYFTHLLYFKGWVRKFQVIQKERSLVVFRIAPTEVSYQPQELDEIAEKTRVVMGPVCNIKFEFMDDIPSSASGKYRYTISEVGEGPNWQSTSRSARAAGTFNA